MAAYRYPSSRWLTTLALLAAGACLLALAVRADRSWSEVHTTWRYCAIEPRELAAFRARRFFVAALGAVLVLAAVPLGRMAGRRMSAGTALRSAMAVVLALVACEIGLRFRKPRPEPPPRLDLPAVIHDDQVLYRLEPSHTTVIDLKERSVVYDVDSDGNRAPVAGWTPDHDAPTLIFAGESITMGLGLRWDETYPAIVGKRFALQVANLGVHGWGMDQGYLRTVDMLGRYSHPAAVVTIAMADQLERNVQVTRRRLALAGGQLVFVDAMPDVWRHSPLRDLFQRTTHYHDAEAVDIAHAIFRDTAAKARAHGAIPLFVLTSYYRPCLADATGAPSIERVLFDGIDVPYVRADIDPDWHLPDGHPDPRADAEIAADIERALRELGLGSR